MISSFKHLFNKSETTIACVKFVSTLMSQKTKIACKMKKNKKIKIRKKKNNHMHNHCTKQSHKKLK